ncbi:MAG: type II CRISPR RNA-guided endonuclease Cas9, partial [Lachnospiraceae bacterium]|nr:type II CRISPR RNA-guided endonuclease Cas9 [Lachnospiraceae bacterium]
MANYEGDYYIGLDMGVASVGWAVTDTSYHLLRAKGKDMWGVRLFKEAETAADRRTSRVSRRRLAREKYRIHMLRELFADEINKIDPGFYHRLEESKYWKEDRTGDNEGQKYAIFAKGTSGDHNYTDVDYYRDYPTIFHLRSDLLHNTNAHDVRLVYLALLNMFKHRGHFLNETLNSDGKADFDSAWNEFIDAYNQVFSYDQDEENSSNPFLDTDLAELKEVMLEKGVSKSKIRENASRKLNIPKKDKRNYQILSLICGLAGSLTDIFGEESFASSEEKSKRNIGFRNGSYDEDIAAVESEISEDRLSLVFAAKEVHDVLLLENILQGEKYLCDARVASYEQHKEDLKLLKETVKRLICSGKLTQSVYDHLFRTMEDGNYSAYVGSTNYDGIKEGKRRRFGSESSKRNSQPEELYKSIKKILEPYKDDRDVEIILKSIDNETFLRKQLTSENGVIPNQVYVREMKAILNTVQAYIPFLSDVDESGLTVSERILKLFSFHIPYFVGPIGGLKDNNGNKWAVRVSGEKITPWNIEKVIDMGETQKAFIENLIRHCTYLSGENVLPKRSLIYEKFMVLNELNNLKISGEPISVELKQDIYNSLFMKGKPVSHKKLVEFLVSRGKIAGEEGDKISGIDGTFHNSLTSIGKFNGIFDAPYLDRDHIHMIEEIILWGTVYGDSKSMFKKLLTEKYGKDSSGTIKLTDSQIKRIAGFKFSDWGRCSKAFLEMEGASKEDGAIRTVIDAMWETNDNLMQLLSESKYTYAEEVKRLSGEKKRELSEWTIEDLDGMYLSAPVKRMVWQTIRVLKEIEEIMGRPPKRIFVEMTRENREKGKRTKSRKSQLMELYGNPDLKNADRNWLSELEGHSEQEYRIRKLYLYYCQMGRCMYSNEEIDIDRLMDDNLYDIDHIYPRNFVKDDSIENNLVLVKKSINNNKQNDFPLNKDIQDRCIGLWKDLLSKRMISKEKYDRLTRNTEFTLDEKVGFVQRQLVETGQGTKAITEILKMALPDTSDIVFSKAGVVSQFRQDFDICKCRELNDFHHAQDAYLNIVVGNVYFTKFTKNPRNFIKEAENNPKDDRYRYHLSKMFDYSVVRGNDVVWISEKNGKNNTISTVKEQVDRNT